MSNRWFYEIDGQVVGPVEQTRLMLLADSGMLQAHHRVRQEHQPAWHPAASIKGLFTPATTPASGVPIAAAVSPAVPATRAAPAAPPPPTIEEPLPFGNWPAPAGDAPAAASVFDFFAESEAPAAP